MLIFDIILEIIDVTMIDIQPSERAATLREFTLDFFRFCNLSNGSTPALEFVQEDTLHVKLGQALAQHFGRPELLLIFNNKANLALTEKNLAGKNVIAKDLTPDLVAFGSRTFDQMIAYLENRSALTVQQLPSRFANSDVLLQAIQPVNAMITNLKLQEQIERLFIFNWRITYRADDKQEEFFTVLLDEDGNRQPYVYEEIGTDSRADNIIESPRDGQTLNLATLFAHAEAVPVGYTEDGQPLPIRLPPMTQLNRLAESARKYAIYHADRNCVDHEAEIMPRLHDSLQRLTTYYQQQIEEIHDIHDPEGEKREALAQDLQRKIAEEVENHRLRVRVHLSSYAVLQIPMAVANMDLSDGKQAISLQIQCNRYSGVVRHPICHACNNSTAQIALDRNGHITCDQCIRQCDTCLELLCESCGVVSCPDCTQLNCETCSEFCWACGGRACAEHTSRCPRCSDTVCHSCQIPCTACGLRQCHSHQRVDCVISDNTPENRGGEISLICSDCAIRCTGCQQYSAHIETCDATGQRFCHNCMATCAQCERRVGKAIYLIYAPDGQAYCTDCLVDCSSCRTRVPKMEQCDFCGADGCYQCGNHCTICNVYGCSVHTYRHDECGHVMCRDHMIECIIGQEPLCSLCDGRTRICHICENYYCEQHTQLCTLCGQIYCANCVNSKRCMTCENALTSRDFIDFMAEPHAQESIITTIGPEKYHWVRSENSRYTVYLGKNPLSNAMIVLDQNMPDSAVLKAEKMKSMEVIGNRMQRKKRG